MKLHGVEVASIEAPGISAEVTLALARAEAAGIEVHLYQLANHWVCATRHEQIAHIEDLPKIIDAALARHLKQVAA